VARSTQNQALAVLFGIGIIVAVPILVAQKTVDTLGPIPTTVAAVLIVGTIVLVLVQRRRARRAYLLSKYGDPHIVGLIMQKRFWEGQTRDQLLDSIGRPAAIDDLLLKTKKKEIWKYSKDGRNRYKLRVTLEGDVVVGWNRRS
jgi:hypothetical protein